ncbi:putative membrane protein [[Clostridium] sordellii ATCC 9714]|nr:putative membrane protein [[Clostridium] sordellii ATCC 9714] [Paeniclostridium sordellii ATCC 9714]
MSAPIAIGICATFGFKRYIYSGIIASFINLLMGTHTILNIIVAMIFRVVAGGLIGIFGSSISVVTIAGPVGTFIGRVIMSFITGASLKALIFAASIGMVYTAISSYLVFKLIKI